MTAVLRTLQENFGPRDEIRGFRPTALTNRRWFLGQDSRKVFAVSLLNETVSPTESAALDAAPLAAVVAPLVPGDTTGTHLIHVLGDDGMVTTLSTTTLAQVGTWTASGEAQTVGALAVGDYGIYAGGLGGIKAYNQETGRAAWAAAGGLGWIKWLAVCRDAPDVIYAIDEGGRWGVFACDGVQVWAVPTAAVDPIPDVINVMTDADYLTSAATGLAVLAKGPLSKGQVTFIDLSSPQEPSVSAVSTTYADFRQTGITGAAATDRPLTQDDAEAFPEIPWWAAIAFAALRGPALGEALDGFVALDGLRRAWLTTEPTTAPAGASPYPAPEPEWPEIGPTCSLTVTETETTAATVAGTCAWQTARDVGPGAGVVSGGSSSVAVAAPGVATIPLSLGVNSLVLTVTDARGATATANDSVRRRAPNPYLLPSSWTYSGASFLSMGFNKYAKLWLDGYRTGSLTFDPTLWKLVFMGSASPLVPPDTAATYADIAAWELSGGTYPTGGVAITAAVNPWGGTGLECDADNIPLNIVLPAGAPGNLARIAILDSANRVVAWNDSGSMRSFFGGATIEDLYGASSSDLFVVPPTLLGVVSYSAPATVINTQDFDANPPTVTLDLMSGVSVVRSVSGVLVYVSQSGNYAQRTIKRRYTMPLLSIPVYTTDPSNLYVKPWITSRPLGVAADLEYNAVGFVTDPTAYTSMDVVAGTYIDLILPGHIP